MNYHMCRYANCAVCNKPDDREIFEYIFKRKNPDLYLCEHVVYKIIGDNGRDFMIQNLSNVIKGMRGYYLINPFTGNPVELNMNNVEILCPAENCTVENPYVLVWKDEVTKGDH